MEQQNSNAVATVTEQSKVTKQLCLEYIKSQNTNLTDGEFAQYAAVATTLNLNPFLREIYPIKYNGKMTLVTGYQVYIRRAEEFPQYDGFDTKFEGAGNELCCICNVYRKDRTRPVTARVYFAEYTQNNSMWNGKPHVMLEKVAIGTAFRRAFPTEFGGMPYTSEEIRAEDELKSQGYHEVRPQPEPHNEQPKLNRADPKAQLLAAVKNYTTKQFAAMLVMFKSQNESAHGKLVEWLKESGWEKPNFVPADRYAEVVERFYTLQEDVEYNG